MRKRADKTKTEVSVMEDKVDTFNEREEAIELALFLKWSCRLTLEELKSFEEELLEVYNSNFSIESYLDSILYRRERKAYEYVVLQKLDEFYKKVDKFRSFSHFKELNKAFVEVEKSML